MSILNISIKGKDPVYRNEWKHLITMSDMIALRQRLSAVARPDPHAVNGKYRIRSLYFDTPTDRALREKIDGVNIRDKFRLRCYDGDISRINLEKKSKRDGVGYKQQAPFTAEETQRLLDGDTDWMKASRQPLIVELYAK